MVLININGKILQKSRKPILRTFLVRACCEPGTSICISIGRAVFWPASQGLIDARVGRLMFCNSRFEFLGRLAFGSLFGPLFITINRDQTELPYPYSDWSLFGRVSSRNTYERWQKPSQKEHLSPQAFNATHQAVLVHTYFRVCIRFRLFYSKSTTNLAECT